MGAGRHPSFLRLCGAERLLGADGERSRKFQQQPYRREPLPHDPRRSAGHAAHHLLRHPAGHPSGRLGLLDAHESPQLAAAHCQTLYRHHARHPRAGVAHADVLCGDGAHRRHGHRCGHRHLCHEHGRLHQRDAAHRHPGHRPGPDRSRTGIGLHPAADLPPHHPAPGGQIGDAGLSGRGRQPAERH